MEAALTFNQLQGWLKLMPTITKTLEAALLSIIPAVLSTEPQHAPAAAIQPPAITFPKLTMHTLQLSDCLLNRQWLWLISGWLPPEQVQNLC